MNIYVCFRVVERCSYCIYVFCLSIDVIEVIGENWDKITFYFLHVHRFENIG